MRIQDARHAAWLIEDNKIVQGTTLFDTEGFYEVTHVGKRMARDEVSVHAVEVYIDENGNTVYPAGSARWLTHYDLAGMEIV